MVLRDARPSVKFFEVYRFFLPLAGFLTGLAAFFAGVGFTALCFAGVGAGTGFAGATGAGAAVAFPFFFPAAAAGAAAGGAGA